MRPFNLDEYLKDTSKKVVTREGKPVKIHCTNFASDNPVIATIEDDEYSFSFSRDGKFIKNIDESDHDLFFASERYEGWINLYKCPNSVGFYVSNPFSSEEEAVKAGKTSHKYLKTVKIEWEEE